MTTSTSTQLSPWATASKHTYVILFLWGGYQAMVSSPFFFKSTPVEHPPWEIGVIHGGIPNPPPRNKKIHWNFDFNLPKFHFILPNFYFGLPWGIFVCSLEISKFLGREHNQPIC